MVKWVVVALVLTSSLVADDPPPLPNPTASATQPKIQKMELLCRRRDGSHIKANDFAPRIVKRTKRDAPPPDPLPAPAPVTVEFRFNCKNQEMALLCPAVTNMCIVKEKLQSNGKEPDNTNAVQFTFADTNLALLNSGSFCSLVGYEKIECAATQDELNSEHMTKEEQCEGLDKVLVPCDCNDDDECIFRPELPDSDSDISFVNHDDIPNDDPLPPGQEKAARTVPPPPPECTNELPKEGQTCRYKVTSQKECFNKCGPLMTQYDCSPMISRAEDGSLLCTIDNLKPKHFKTHGTHFEKLSKRILEKSSPSIAPMIFLQSDTDAVKHSVVVLPLAAQITEVKEKDQSISVMLASTLIWTDSRLSWSSKEFGNISEIRVTRESIWRPPLFPDNMLSFSNEDVLKSNLRVLSTGKVFDSTIWNFKIAADMNFDYFPFDSQKFVVTISTSQDDLKLLGPDYIITETESQSEWKIIEDFTKIETKDNNQTLAYKVVIKRFPYMWNNLIIVPCFILGFLVIAALTLGADSNSIESLVNIGLAASVASAVVVSTLTDNFPKTENIPSIAYFVRNQFIIIVSVLIKLFIRKAFMPLIDAKLEAWQKPEAGAELSSSKKALIIAVKVAKHRFLLFAVFALLYVGSFFVMMRHADFNFERKPRASLTGMEHHKIFSRIKA